MPNMTLSFPERTRERMAQHPQARWSSVVRRIIEHALDDFEKADRLAKKANLRMEDFSDIERKMAHASRKHAEALF